MTLKKTREQVEEVMKDKKIEKIEIKNTKFCKWCNEEVHIGFYNYGWGNHPYECPFFGAIINEMRIGISEGFKQIDHLNSKEE